MRNETRRMRVNDPDASPGWYDEDDSDQEDFGQNGAPGGAIECGARPTTGRHATVLAAHRTPYTTHQFAAMRPRHTIQREPCERPGPEVDTAGLYGFSRSHGLAATDTADLAPLPPITRRIPAVTGDGAAPERRTLRPVSAELRAFSEAATGKRPAMPRGITLVPGRKASGAVASQRPVARRMTGRPNWKISVGAILLVLTLAGALRVFGLGGAGPLGYDGLAAAVGQPTTASMPVGRRIAGANFPDASANPWQAGAFSVPMLGGGGASAPGALAKAPTPVPTAPHRADPPSAPAATSGVLAAPFTPWPPSNPWMAIPGHAPYRVYDYAGDPYAAAFGQCTWWAQHERPDQSLRGMGNARYWATGAAARGYRVGTIPQANATVVFQPFVQGASPVGHVGHVVAVYPGGWFLMSEMNAFGNGGGWGRVSYRYARAGPGVSFIY